MISKYLYFNSAIYLILALWCILLPEKTSKALGFELINSSGKSEYFVVYGALQIGLALFFAFTARQRQHQRIGIIFSLCLYLPIFLFRMISFYRWNEIGSTTFFTAVLEILLTFFAIFLYFKLAQTYEISD